jgi:hypothetical protein
MKLWYKPPFYTASHIASGVLSYYFPIIFPLIVIYHGIQYVMNIRFFILEKAIRPGNSLSHTILKLAETLLGLLVASAIYLWRH